MGAHVRYGTIAVGAYHAHQPGTHQPAFMDQYHPRWDRGKARGPRTWKDRNRFRSLWSFGCRLGGGTDSPEYATVGINNLALNDIYEPYSCDGEGCSQNRFMRGTCVDASDVPVAFPIVQAFRTSDDAFMGEAQGYEDGTYIVPVASLAGVQHYLVAYKPGSPDIAGTTVNTLTNTNVDGT